MSVRPRRAPVETRADADLFATPSGGTGLALPRRVACRVEWAQRPRKLFSGVRHRGVLASQLRRDCRTQGLNGQMFDTTFYLAGDTQRKAVARFLRLFAEHAGDLRRIFDPDKSKGASLKLFLRVPEGRSYEGWNCLNDGSGSGRAGQLSRRIGSKGSKARD